MVVTATDQGPHGAKHILLYCTYMYFFLWTKEKEKKGGENRKGNGFFLHSLLIRRVCVCMFNHCMNIVLESKCYILGNG